MKKKDYFNCSLEGQILSTLERETNASHSYSGYHTGLKVHFTHDSIRALSATLADHQILMYQSNFYFLCQCSGYTAQ